MGLDGSLVSQMDIKLDASVLFETLTKKIYLLSEMSPDLVQGIELHSGEWGGLGSTMNWHFNIEGQRSTARDMIDALDENKKLVSFKILKGTLLEYYTAFTFITNIDSKEDGSTVTHTLIYEKLNEIVPDPHQVIDFLIGLTKDIDNYHLSKST